MLSKRLKEAVLDAYGRKCLKCGATKNLSVDHVVPVSLGGTDDVSNLQPLCRSCNAQKSAKHSDHRKQIVMVEIPKTRKTKRLLRPVRLNISLSEWMHDFVLCHSYHHGISRNDVICMALSELARKHGVGPDTFKE